jgi:hypothetical protein
MEREARGCPRCAWNVEAEMMIDRMIWKMIVLGVIFVGLVVIAVAYLLR